MGKYAIIKFCHLSPLHIGTGRENYDSSSSWLHSDTITSALAALKAQRGDSDIEEFLSRLIASSAFPFYKDMYFLPKAHGHVNFANEAECRKSLKRVAFIERGLWLRLARGEQLSSSDATISGSLMYPSDYACPRLSCTQVTQRVRVYPDASKDADPFFFEWRYFDKDSGLYFLTTAEGEFLDEVVGLSRQLGSSGLGTDKNVGGGTFEVEVSELEFDDSLEANASVLLSMYIPNEQELPVLNLDESHYSLLRRGGFAAGSSVDAIRHLRKRSIHMFDEGSVFKTREKLSGKVVDLRPEWNSQDMHPIYRSGKPFLLPYKI